MNETVLLSSKFISKEVFEEKIVINGYQFKNVGNNDELWLIENKTDRDQ